MGSVAWLAAPVESHSHLLRACSLQGGHGWQAGEAWLAAGSVDEERVVLTPMRWCLCIYLPYVLSTRFIFI